MSNIAGTIKSVSNVAAPVSSVGSRYVYALAIECGAMTAGDTASVTGVDTIMASFLKNGRTVTLRQCAGGPAGLTPGGTAAHAILATVNGASLQYSVGGLTEAAAAAAGTIVNMFVTVDES